MSEKTTFKPAKGQLPVKMCDSCAHCSGIRCQIHQREVQTNYNRCFFHSDYQPEAQTFHVSPNLEKIILAELIEKDKKCVSYTWEDKKFLNELREDIALAKKLGNIA